MATIVKPYSAAESDTSVYLSLKEHKGGVLVSAVDGDGNHMKNLLHINQNGVYLFGGCDGIGLTVSGEHGSRLCIRETM